MQLLILLVVIVGIVALGQLAKVYELSSRLSGRREEDISHADTRLNANLWLVFMVGFFASVIYLYRRYGDYAPPPASEHGVQLDWLMSFNIWIITAVFFLVNTLLFVLCLEVCLRQGPQGHLLSARQPFGVDLDGDSFHCFGRHHHLWSSNLECHDRRCFGRRLEGGALLQAV